MRIVEIADGILTVDFQVSELPEMIEMARIAEVNAAAAYCTDLDEELHPYYQEREDLILVAGLWGSVLEMALMLSDRLGTYTQSKYQHLRYIAGREKRKAEKAEDCARQEYPEAHSLHEYLKKEREAKAAAVEVPVPEVTEERIPRPTDQQSGELSES